MTYTTPDQYRLDLHFPRSRFSRNLEDRLLVMANAISDIGSAPKEEFDRRIDSILVELNEPGLEEKTIANQRTEMISLYGLAKYKDGQVYAGTRTLSLVNNQDVPQFFKSLIEKFQYPGGFVKPHVTKEYIKAGVRFKPGQYLIRMLRCGKELTGKTVAVTAKEVAYLVFNDTRVTVQHEAPCQRMKLILNMRKENIVCDNTSDVIRYARDFLNYMVQANLLIEFEKGYFLNEKEKTALDYLAANDSFFDEYSKSLLPDGNIDEEAFNKAESDWYDWFADVATDEDIVLSTPIDSFEKETVNVETEDNETVSVTTGYELPPEIQRLKAAMEAGQGERPKGRNLKEIGDEGEAIICNIERDRVGRIRPDLLPLVRIVSNDTSLGFDIQSFFDDGLKKYIEVKTTKRNFAPDSFIATSYFTISINEWLTAKQHKDAYFIYRVIIAKEQFSIFVICNPHAELEKGNIALEPTGYKLIYKEGSGRFLVKDQTYS